MERKPGIIERTKKFGKENVLGVAEGYFGLFLAAGFPILTLPSIAGVICIIRAGKRLEKAWSF